MQAVGEGVAEPEGEEDHITAAIELLDAELDVALVEGDKFLLLSKLFYQADEVLGVCAHGCRREREGREKRAEG